MNPRWTRPSLRAAILPLIVGLAVATATAQHHPARSGVQVSDFWREVQTPGVRRASVLLRHGLRQLTQALGIDDRAQRETTLEGAVARLRRAHELAPDDVDILYFLAFASSQRQLVQRQADAGTAVRDAIALYEELRARDEDYEAESVAFELGLLHTRLRQYARAIEEYERGILRAFDPRSTVSAHANMAEVIMLNGDAASALLHYDRAAEIARQYAGDPASLALALWGGAVASDRLGEGTAALERAGAALNASGGDMLVLRQNGVFFEPESEIHWYEGLGALALAETASDRDERLAALRRALRSFQTYLTEVETPATWDRVVEGRVRQIEQQLATLAGGAPDRRARTRPGRRP